VFDKLFEKLKKDTPTQVLAFIGVLFFVILFVSFFVDWAPLLIIACILAVPVIILSGHISIKNKRQFNLKLEKIKDGREDHTWTKKEQQEIKRRSAWFKLCMILRVIAIILVLVFLVNLI